MTTLLALTELVSNVFGEDVELTETTTADQIDGWDSIMHLNVVIAIEQHFKIKFTTAEISRMKEEGQNIGSLVQLIESKLG